MFPEDLENLSTVSPTFSNAYKKAGIDKRAVRLIFKHAARNGAMPGLRISVGQGIPFFPEMSYNPEELIQGPGVGIRAGMPDLGRGKDTQVF